jgi:5'(3')-deoxyribonucleotidase
MNRGLKIGIDIDDTLCDLVPSVCNFAQIAFKMYIVKENVTSWNPEFDGICFGNIVSEFFRTYEFGILDLPPIVGAVESLRLMSRYNEITLITHRPSDKAKITERWVREKLGNYPILHENGVKGKGMDVLIDDRTSNITDFGGKLGILFTQPWNAKDSHADHKCKELIRAADWHKIKDIVLWHEFRR